MQKRVGFGLRLGALIIDSFIIGFLASILLSFLMENTFDAFMKGQLMDTLFSGGANDTPEKVAAMEGVMRISSFITNLGLMYMLIEAFTGASPGKMILGIKIGTQDGKPADTRLLFYRYLIKNGSSLLALAGRITGLVLINDLAGIGGFVIFAGCFMALGQNKQALHDVVVGSAVFRKQELESQIIPGGQRPM